MPFMDNDANSYEVEELDISLNLKQKVLGLLKYKNNESIFSEILAYMSYEATIINIFKFPVSEEESFLIISGNDGGLNEGNKNSLNSSNLGDSSQENISYFGAGARTAAKQWTESIKQKLFGIIDSKEEVFYRLGGGLGLEIIRGNSTTFKKHYNFNTEPGYSYWILPYDTTWDSPDSDVIDTLKRHFGFMYNKKMINEELTFTFLGDIIRPQTNLFHNSNPDVSLGTKFVFKTGNNCLNDIFSHHTNLSIKMEYIRYTNKDNSPNKKGEEGARLRIYNNDVEVHELIIKKPSTTDKTKLGYKTRPCIIDEPIQFSFEYLDFAKQSDNPGIESTRKKEIKDNFNLEQVHGIRYQMEDNFIAKENCDDIEKWGTKNNLVLFINLTKSQYKKFAKPHIKRTDGWDINEDLKLLTRTLYSHLSNLGNKWHKDYISDQQKKAQILKTNIIINKTYTPEEMSSIQKIQRNFKIYLNRKQIMDCVKQAIIKHKLSMIKQKENETTFNEDLKLWETTQKQFSGCLYIRTTKQMKEYGIYKYGNPICKIGKTSNFKQRMESYARNEYHSSEDSDIVIYQDDNVYYYERAETSWIADMNCLGWNLKTKNDTKGTEFYVESLEVIQEKLIDIITKSKEQYEYNKRTKIEELKRKYNINF